MVLYNLLTALIVIAAILLTLLVLVQNSKGGGLAASFASGNQVMGAPKTADFLEKASWWLIGIIVVLSIAAVGASKGGHSKAKNEPSQETKANFEQQAQKSQQANTADYETEAAAQAE